MMNDAFFLATAVCTIITAILFNCSWFIYIYPLILIGFRSPDLWYSIFQRLRLGRRCLELTERPFCFSNLFPTWRQPTFWNCPNAEDAIARQQIDFKFQINKPPTGRTLQCYLLIYAPVYNNESSWKQSVNCKIVKRLEEQRVKNK